MNDYKRMANEMAKELIRLGADEYSTDMTNKEFVEWAKSVLARRGVNR